MAARRAQGVVINEVIAKTSNPLEDAIELHNTGSTAADVSGWWLSDDYDPVLDPALAQLKKYRIPDGTIIPAAGYAVFYQAQFNGAAAALPFSLTQDGETVFLSSADGAGTLTGFIGAQPFQASVTNVAQGRVPLSNGWDFAALTAQTFGVANPVDRPAFRLGTGLVNAPPIVGPVLISEISYHPGAGGVEFIEIGNAGPAAVSLDGWRLEGAAFTFPAGTTLAAGAVLVVADTLDAAAFRSVHSIAAAVQIFPHVFDLGDAGESLELLRPNESPLRPMIRVERVRFNDQAPWPTAAAGTGATLERLSCTAYANDPASWLAGSSPGTWGCTVSNPDSDNDGLPDSWEITYGLNPADSSDAQSDLDGDGASSAFEFASGTNPNNNQSVLTLRAGVHSEAGQTLRFPSVVGRNYRLEFSGDLLEWLPKGSVVSGNGSEIELLDATAPAGSRRFYRLLPLIP